MHGIASIHLFDHPSTSYSLAGLEAIHSSKLSKSSAAIANLIREHKYFHSFGSDLSFLDELSRAEKASARKIYDAVEDFNPEWDDKVKEVQPWVQDVYMRLANVFKLVVNLDSRHGGKLGNVYADHYLTFPDWSNLCNTKRRTIDYMKCWAFEDKVGWTKPYQDEALRQAVTYSIRFFEKDMNRMRNYVSIITDGHTYMLYHAYWKGGLHGGLTDNYDWSKDTLEILGRVFKTCKAALRANASPRSFGNLRASKDISAIAELLPVPHLLDCALDPKSRIDVLYNSVMECEKMTSSGLPIVTTPTGDDIETIRLLGTGSNTVVFEGSTADKTRVIIKYGLYADIVRPEAEALKRLVEVRDCYTKASVAWIPISLLVWLVRQSTR